MKNKSTIKFANGSEITTTETCGNVRSKRGEEQIKYMTDYIKRYPDLYIESILGVKLKWYDRLIIRLKMKGK